MLQISLAHSLNSYGSSSPEEASLPLLQAGALVGESVWFEDQEYVVSDKPIAICWHACKQRGLRPLSICPGTHAFRAEMRYLVQLCNCSSPEGCACDVVALYDRKQRKSVNWRTSHLPKIVDFFWSPPLELRSEIRRATSRRSPRTRDD